MKTVSIKENSWLAKIAAAKMKSAKVAIVFGSTIHLHNTTREEFLKDTDWVCHELQHVEQYKQHGSVGFVYKYLFDWMKNGYYNNRFEVDARKNDKNVELLKKYKID